MASNMGLYRSYVMLLLGALSPIYAGAQSSLKMPKSARKKLRELEGDKKTKQEEEEEEEENDGERLTREDAYWFPVLGSVVLFSLFLCFKYLPKEWINRMLGGYMAIMAVAGLARSGVKVTQKVIGEEKCKGLVKWKLSLTKNGADEGHLTFTRLHLFILPLAALVSAAQLYTNHWILSNLVALSFSFNAISLLYIDSFATGSVLLAGLFFYDIWWVFGSKAVFGKGADVMVTVATSFEAPIKLLAPKTFAKGGSDFSLLGLGDIVLPGIFIALALRFDYFMALRRATVPFKPSSSYPRPYFWTVFAAYFFGLVTTVFIMHTFRAAQPALLYLSPACILSVVGCAALRGEGKELCKYVDGEEEEEEKVVEDDGPEKGKEEAKKEK
ncbi:hypothetical protein JCM11641_002172 [Rhodosporidiobolus odoratus]